VELIQLPIVQGGAAIVLLGVVWAVITGRLIPRGTVNSLREEDRLTIARQDAEIKEWRTAWIAGSQVQHEIVSQVEVLLRAISKDAPK
jgi:hypothetical protein